MNDVSCRPMCVRFFCSISAGSRPGFLKHLKFDAKFLVLFVLDTTDEGQTNKIQGAIVIIAR